jgi:hypothetical protein
MLFGFEKELPGSWIVWGGGTAVLILGILYWTLTGYPEGDYRPPHQDLGLRVEKIKNLNSNKYKVEEEYEEVMGLLFINWKFIPKVKDEKISKIRNKKLVKKGVAVSNGKVVSSWISFYVENDSIAERVFKEKEKDIDNRMTVGNVYNCWREDQYFESGICGGGVWETENIWVRLEYENQKEEDRKISLSAELQRIR